MQNISYHQYEVILKGEDEINDLNVVPIKYKDGTIAMVSCWELSDLDLSILNKTKRVYLAILTTSHPPVKLGTLPIEVGIDSGQLKKIHVDMDEEQAKNKPLEHEPIE